MQFLTKRQFLKKKFNFVKKLLDSVLSYPIVIVLKPNKFF